jgi:hypothetical protein
MSDMASREDAATTARRISETDPCTRVYAVQAGNRDELRQWLKKTMTEEAARQAPEVTMD